MDWSERPRFGHSHGSPSDMATIRPVDQSFYGNPVFWPVSLSGVIVAAPTRTPGSALASVNCEDQERVRVVCRGGHIPLAECRFQSGEDHTGNARTGGESAIGKNPDWT